MLPLHLSVLVLHIFAFRPMVPRQPSRSNLADPDITLGSVLYFLLFQALSSAFRPVTRRSFASWLFLFHRSTDGPTSAFHVQRRDSDVIVDSDPYFLSFGKWPYRQPLRPYASGRKLVWRSQRDTCSLLLFWHCFRVYTFLFGFLRIVALSG